MTPTARLAFGKPSVYVSPDWMLELLIALVALMGVALLVNIGQLATSREEALQAQGMSDFWREVALAPETLPTVRIEAEGVGFKCTQFNVRREWERVVATKCQELGGLLIQARSTP